ncbi:putative ankyrin repeat protein RF_0381 isoform X2 [Microplitis mediator]|nr:putative ankyrin repeat protein RF_0381 isoform X2 [Microplitis mediator]
MASSTYTSLLQAVQKKDITTVKRLLNNGTPVNVQDTKPRDTPLHLSVDFGNLCITKILLKYNANIFVNNNENVCPLEIAMLLNNTDIKKLFLEHIPPYNSITPYNYTKIIVSFLKNMRMNKQVINYLNNPPAQIIIKDSPGIIKALHLAITYGKRNIIGLLLENGVNVNGIGEPLLHFDERTALSIACKHPTTHSLVQYLMDKGAKVNVDGVIDTALHAACISGNLDLVKLLVNSGADMYVKNSDGKIPITLGVENKQISIVKFLLNVGQYNISYQKLKYVVYAAVYVGEFEYIKGYLKWITKLNYEHRIQYGINSEVLKNILCSDTYWHSSSDTHKCIKSMVLNSFDINFKNSSGITPLFSALMIGYGGVVAELLQYGADINQKCIDGRSAFYHFYQAIKSRKRLRQISIDHEPYKVRPLRDQRVVDIFAQHVIKMEMLKLAVNQVDYANAIELYKNPRVQEQRYEKEVENLRKTVICDGVTFYDLASANVNQMIKFLNKDVINETLKTGKYKKRFRDWDYYKLFISQRTLQKVIVGSSKES